MPRTRCLLAAMTLTVAAASGCGSPHAAAPSPDAPRPTTEPSGTSRIELPAERPAGDYPMADPPRFHVLTEDGQVALRPWTICGPGYCADGAPDDDHLVDVGRVDHLDFGFDLSGWQFRDVTFRELTRDCPRAITVPATRTGERTFRVDPAGPPGRWAVDIFGRGPGGDAVTTVEWTTTRRGPDGPAPTGVAAVVADHDGRLDSYGVELSLTGLDAAYGDATASITVASDDGEEVTIPLRRSGGCTYEGHLFFTASEARGQQAAALGDAPFTYSATVQLGGVSHTGTASWPDDVVPGNEPNVALAWDPPLPAYRG
jgi:hypothetical protein